MLLLWHGKALPAEAEPPILALRERVGGGSRGSCGALVLGDNAGVSRAWLAGGLRPRLIYADPPFATGQDFGAYNDAWDAPDAYLQMLYERLALLCRLLADDGALFLHLDWRAASHARLLLDELLGSRCFRNEIVWAYRRWPARARAFQRLHDSILFYVKDPARYTWNQLFEPLSPGTVRTHGSRRQLAVFDGKRRVNSVDTDETSPGSPMTDVWSISVINARARERNGYPTQKPEALLERIILATTQPGDLVADPFCGSGTTPAVAERLGRAWLACDTSERAVALTRDRLARLGARFEVLSTTPAEAGRAGISAGPGRAAAWPAPKPAPPGIRP